MAGGLLLLGPFWWLYVQHNGWFLGISAALKRRYGGLQLRLALQGECMQILPGNGVDEKGFYCHMMWKWSAEQTVHERWHNKKKLFIAPRVFIDLYMCLTYWFFLCDKWLFLRKPLQVRAKRLGTGSFITIDCAWGGLSGLEMLQRFLPRRLSAAWKRGNGTAWSGGVDRKI